MATNLIRDPVHDFIYFDQGNAFDKLLVEIINLPVFQRLRRISQLGFSSYVYPGATHSRFSHSLGVVVVSHKMVNQLQKHHENEISDDDKQNIILAALLHDIGHGPFSHAFEKITKKKHEFYSAGILERPDVSTKLGSSLSEIRRFIQANRDTSFLGHIISSQLDADRFDYLLRDNIMTGAQYGHFDLQWIIKCLRCNSAENRLEVSHKGQLALEGYLQSRYHMYRNVYYHKSVRAAEQLFQKVFDRAKCIAMSGDLPGCQTIIKILKEQDISIDEYISLDEPKVLSTINEWSIFEKDEILSDLSSCLIDRKLFKAVIDFSADDKISPTFFAEGYSRIKEYFDAIRDGSYYWCTDDLVDTPYRPYSPDDKNPKTSIYIRRKNEGPKEISKCSQTVEALTKDFYMHRIFVHPKYVNEVRLKLEA